MKQAPADKEAEDQKVAADLKKAVYDLRALMAKADKRGITCSFNEMVRSTSTMYASSRMVCVFSGSLMKYGEIRPRSKRIPFTVSTE